MKAKPNGTRIKSLSLGVSLGLDEFLWHNDFSPKNIVGYIVYRRVIFEVIHSNTKSVILSVKANRQISHF